MSNFISKLHNLLSHKKGSLNNGEKTVPKLDSHSRLSEVIQPIIGSWDTNSESMLSSISLQRGIPWECYGCDVKAYEAGAELLTTSGENTAVNYETLLQGAETIWNGRRGKIQTLRTHMAEIQERIEELEAEESCENGWKKRTRSQTVPPGSRDQEKEEMKNGRTGFGRLELERRHAGEDVDEPMRCSIEELEKKLETKPELQIEKNRVNGRKSRTRSQGVLLGSRNQERADVKRVKPVSWWEEFERRLAHEDGENDMEKYIFELKEMYRGKKDKNNKVTEDAEMMKNHVTAPMIKATYGTNLNNARLILAEIQNEPVVIPACQAVCRREGGAEMEEEPKRTRTTEDEEEAEGRPEGDGMEEGDLVQKELKQLRVAVNQYKTVAESAENLKIELTEIVNSLNQRVDHLTRLLTDAERHCLEKDAQNQGLRLVLQLHQELKRKKKRKPIAASFPRPPPSPPSPTQNTVEELEICLRDLRDRMPVFEQFLAEGGDDQRRGFPVVQNDPRRNQEDVPK